jgi:hypothetical protein
MDDLVEIATVTFPADADILKTLLREAGIMYFLKNRGSSIVRPTLTVGGLTLAVRSPDVPAAIDLMKRDGLEKHLIIKHAELSLS